MTDFVVSDTERGTSEDEWLASPLLASRRELDLRSLRHGPVIVIAPHPDDEVLSLGGLVQRLADAGHPIAIVAVTDGEGSHPRSPSTSRAELAARRTEERNVALTRLGVAAVTVTRLVIADGAVSRARDLDVRFRPLLAGAALCLAPWEKDGHPDHDAAGAAALLACARAGVRLLRYVVWGWHRLAPSTQELPWESARRITLTDAELARKREAIAAYRSQLLPLSSAEGDAAVLPSFVIARFERPFEMVLT